jgi:hypothetical protein
MRMDLAVATGDADALLTPDPGVQAAVDEYQLTRTTEQLVMGQ